MEGSSLLLSPQGCGAGAERSREANSHLAELLESTLTVKLQTAAKARFAQSRDVDWYQIFLINSSVNYAYCRTIILYLYNVIIDVNESIN